MKKFLKKRIIVPTIIFCMIVLLFKDCYSIETFNIKNYKSFYNRMEKEDTLIYEALPNPENLQIEEVYLYYSDFDLLDSFYTVYLNCIFDDAGDYAIEKARLYRWGREWAFTELNSPSFEYKSIVQAKSLDKSKKYCEYVLYDDDEHRIVYVYMFDMYHKYENIPSKYLPMELRQVG